MENLKLGSELMGYGLAGVFLALVLFYGLIKIMLAYAKSKAKK